MIYAQRLCLLLALVVLALPRSAAAHQIQIGRTTLQIPAPEGFTEVAGQSVAMEKLGHSLTPPENRFHAMFFDAGDVARVKSGEAPVMRRYMMAQSLRAGEYHRLTNDEIRELMVEMRKQSQTGIDQYKKDINDTIRDQLPESGVAMLGSQPVGVFLDEETVHGNVMKIRFRLNSGEEFETAVATAVAVIDRKVVYLYVYAAHDSEYALDWVRATAKEWVRETYRANRPDAQAQAAADSAEEIVAETQESGEDAGLYDYGNTAQGAGGDDLPNWVKSPLVVGALAGGIAALLLALIMRRKDDDVV